MNPDGRDDGDTPAAVPVLAEGVAGRVHQRRQALHTRFLSVAGRILRIAAHEGLLAPADLCVIGREVAGQGEVAEQRELSPVSIGIDHVKQRAGAHGKRGHVHDLLSDTVELVQGAHGRNAERVHRRCRKGTHPGANGTGNRPKDPQDSLKSDRDKGRRRPHQGIQRLTYPQVQVFRCGVCHYRPGHQPDHLPDSHLIGDHRPVGIGGKIQIPGLQRGNAEGSGVCSVLQLHLLTGQNAGIDQGQRNQHPGNSQQQDQDDGLAPLFSITASDPACPTRGAAQRMRKVHDWTSCTGHAYF